MCRIIVTASPATELDWSDAALIRDVLAKVWRPEATLATVSGPDRAAALARDCWASWGGRVRQHELAEQPNQQGAEAMRAGRASA